MSFKLDIPQLDMLKPRIVIFGVGGAGGNAINNMIRSDLAGVEFVAANTDAQALSNSLAPNIIQLGLGTTKGLGAGSFPDKGKAAAEENIAEIERFLDGCHMVFIAAGMGGGTGTGAAPVIAELARKRDVLTVGVVTKPFHFEGKYRMDIAEKGIEELKKFVDTLIVIPNQNLFRIANEQTTFESAFKMADDVLHAGVRGVTDLITMPGIVNLDFADIRTIMTKMGKAMMGTGEAEGSDRAVTACEAAIANPLLDDISIKGAKGVLVNMTGGPDMTLFEAELAVNTIKKQVDQNANIIFGSAFNENMRGKIRISVVATGIDIEEAKKNDYIHQNKDFRSSFISKQDRVEENKDSNKNFFDTSAIYQPKEEKLEEIKSVDFKPEKTYLKDPNPNYHHNIEKSKDNILPSSVKSNDSYDDIYDSGFKKNQNSNTDSNYEDQPFNIEQSNNDIDINLSHHTTRRKESKKSIKKENSGFSLFSFMNSAKNKRESIIEDDLDFLDIASDKKHKKSRNIDKDLDNNHNYKNNIKDYDEDNRDLSSIENDLEDDIMNVPAFFRKKNNNDNKKN